MDIDFTKLQGYEIVFDENDFDTLDFMGFVNDPAIEKNAMYFNRDKQDVKTFADEEKGLFTGPALIPHKKIYRESFDEQYYVTFSEEVIEKMRDHFITKAKQNNTNFDHARTLNGNYMVESWIIKDPENDKANAMGFVDLPKGTLMMTYKVENQTVRNLIKDGFINGFSVEGWFTERAIEMSVDNNKEIEEVLKEIEKIAGPEDIELLDEAIRQL